MRLYTSAKSERKKRQGLHHSYVLGWEPTIQFVVSVRLHETPSDFLKQPVNLGPKQVPLLLPIIGFLTSREGSENKCRNI